MSLFPPGEQVEICYVNHRGELSVRRIMPKAIRFGIEPPWHTEPQWLLDAFDVDKKAERTFAMKDIHYWRAVPE